MTIRIKVHNGPLQTFPSALEAIYFLAALDEVSAIDCQALKAGSRMRVIQQAKPVDREAMVEVVVHTLEPST